MRLGGRQREAADEAARPDLVPRSPGLESVGSTAALRAAGYEILGGVMGASVEHLSLVGYRAKDWATDRRWEPDDDPPLVSTDRRYPFPLREYALALQSGWDVALDRLTAACRGIGGDGVVGIVVSEQVPSRGNKISCSPVPPCGEAVIGGRARTFLTTLGGFDLSKLREIEWVPRTLVFGTAVGIRRADLFSLLGTKNVNWNDDVPMYTELVSGVRRVARHELERRARSAGAGGVLVSLPIRVHVEELKHHDRYDVEDHMAVATIIGDTIVRSERSEPRHPVAVIALG